MAMFSVLWTRPSRAGHDADVPIVLIVARAACGPHPGKCLVDTLASYERGDPTAPIDSRGRCSAGPAVGHRTRRARRPGPGHVTALACGSISHMTELTDVSGAFGYGDSILVGERVRLRGVRDDDLPTLAKWQMDPGRMATLSSWVAPPSEAAAKERIAKWSANEKEDLGFAIETLDDPPVLVGHLGLWGARPQGPVRDARDRPRP